MATGSKVFSAAKSWRVPNRGAAVPGANIVLNAAVPFTHNNVLGVTSGDRALMTVEAGRAEATLSETYAKRAKSRAKFERDYRLSLSVQDFKNRWAQYRTTASSPRVHYGTKQEANDCANISVMRAVFTQGRKSYISHGPTAYHRKFSNVAIGNDGMKIEENEGKYGWSHPVRSDPFLREGPRQQPFAVYNLRDATASGKTYEQNGNPANSAKWMHNFERQDAVIHKVARQMNGMGAYYHNTNKSGARQTQLLQWYKSLLETPVPVIRKPKICVYDKTPRQPRVEQPRYGSEDTGFRMCDHPNAQYVPGFGSATGRMERAEL